MQLSNKYEELTLKQLADRLMTDYYRPVSNLIGNALDKVDEVRKADTEGQIAHFTDACEQLLCRAEDYIEQFDRQLVPYIDELNHKDAAGHNCETCSGKCGVGHSMHLVTITEGHLQLTAMLYEVKKAAMPFHFNHNYPHIYRALRNDMLLIDNLLNELFHIEEARLVSGMIAAQKRINAHS